MDAVNLPLKRLQDEQKKMEGGQSDPKLDGPKQTFFNRRSEGLIPASDLLQLLGARWTSG